MNDNLACARARESARAWADQHIGQSDETAIFGPADLVAAFVAGWADRDKAVDLALAQLVDARNWLLSAERLIMAAATRFRSYEAQHRDKAARWRHMMTGPDSLRKTQADIDDTIAKAERNAEIAARLEAWLTPLRENPAEVLRQIAEGMVDGETIKGVDHASFDQAAAELAQPVPWRMEGVADLAAFRVTTGDPRFDPSRPVTINGFLYVPAKENEHG